jgi:hypothetical protein
MLRAGFQRAAKIEDADAVFFVGGADVNPMLYGEEPHRTTHYDTRRDVNDLYAWRMAKDKLKIGVCRGGQFLNVMNGGKLWQNVDNHGVTHELTDHFTGEKFMVSSTHHQQFRPAQDGIVIATARESINKEAMGQIWKWQNNGTPMDTYFAKDHEVIWYPGTQSLCFQPHPEYTMPMSCSKYFLSVLKKCMANEYVHPNEQKKAEAS